MSEEEKKAEEAAEATEDTQEEKEGEPAEEGQETEEDPLALAQAEAAENYDRYLRTAAELENFRKRTARMRQETRDDALRDVLLQIAPIMDNLRRALGQENADAEVLKQGVELIGSQFEDVLKGYGLEAIDAVGEAFDPVFHEAMLQVESAEHEPGTVMQEMEKGYRLRDKVLRPARVVVAKAPAEPETAESSPEDSDE